VSETIDLLRELSQAFGVAGFEDEVRDIIRRVMELYTDEIRVDVLGNLIATRKGKTEKVLMLDAHMDEIGFMVSYIEEDGFLRFTTLGGWDARILPSHAMTIRTEEGRTVKGVIGTPPPHILKPEDRKKPYKIEDLFVDIGAASADEVRGLGIRIGSPAVITYPFERLNEKLVMGKALDDRAGCAVLIETLRALKDEELDVTLVANFAVCEEVGLRGARTAAYQIEPDLALALEGTVGADVPGIPGARRPTALGKGPAITVADRSLIVHPKLVRFLSQLAEEEGLPYQLKVPPFGSTDAGAIQQTRGGALAGVLSVPCRYIHSPFSLLRLDDFENTVRLATAFVRRCREILER
jgi:endoglucanase